MLNYRRQNKPSNQRDLVALASVSAAMLGFSTITNVGRDQEKLKCRGLISIMLVAQKVAGDTELGGQSLPCVIRQRYLLL